MKPSYPPDPAVKDRERGAAAREVAQRAPRERRGSTAKPRGPPEDSEALAAKLADAVAEAISKEADAFSIAGFCRRHGLSLPMFYKLASQGLAPQTFNVGVRELVSREAAAAWRREREKAANSARRHLEAIKPGPKTAAYGTGDGTSLSESNAS
jgi:hypothetical protein